MIILTPTLVLESHLALHAVPHVLAVFTLLGLTENSLPHILQISIGIPTSITQKECVMNSEYKQKDKLRQQTVRA